MPTDTNIFKRTICDICKTVEYKPYNGQAIFDGGFTRTANFEKTGYKFCQIGERSFYACPACFKNIESSIESLRRAEQIKKTAGRSE